MSQSRIARRWMEYCGPDEWGHDTMERIAKARLAADPSLDSCQVYEHGGWYLEWNRDGLRVGTANDAACFPEAVIRWCRQWDDAVFVGHTRRPEADVCYDNYHLDDVVHHAQPVAFHVG